MNHDLRTAKEDKRHQPQASLFVVAMQNLSLWLFRISRCGFAPPIGCERTTITIAGYLRIRINHKINLPPFWASYGADVFANIIPVTTADYHLGFLFGKLDAFLF